MKAALALVFLAAPALADEAWMTDGGIVYYQADVGNAAVLSIPYGENDMAFVYVEGLPGAMESRGTHAGYWIGPGEGPCTAMLTGPDGYGSTNWGWATIEFDAKVFPSGFTAFMGECAYDGQSWEMRAEPG